ncbi:MAG: DUF4625 domain-containing protein [Bacteroidales bacterium]|nr:DUF4625 domain-containing protein [Bacteroidales bacterium]
MKSKIIVLAIVVATGLVFSSCEKEVAKPEITLTEVGLNNSKTAIVGDDLHIEADIVAEGTIKTVLVEIHPEGTGTWELDTTYSKFSGKKNSTFHEHIDIPLTAEVGDYHFHLVVTDELGNETTAESEIEFLAASSN